MPKARRSDIEAQIAALQASLDDADTDDEVWVKDDSGREVKVTGKRATGILAKLGLLDDDSGAGDDDQDDDDQDDDQGASGGYFRRKK